MDIKFLSPAEEASFSEMIHNDSELSELVGSFLLKLGVDTDYDEVMVSFDGDNVIRIGIEDSPYTAVLDEDQQMILLEQDDFPTTEEEFSDDGVDSIIDMIA